MPSQSRQIKDNDDIRERILHAAESRFRSFGYSKTTMAEIASDCGMSAANIYRFFEYKQGIAVALAKRDLNDLEEKLAEVAGREDESARDRLKILFLTNLRYLHKCWSHLPRFHELVDDVCASRPELVMEHMQKKQTLVVEVLEAGRTNQEFDFVDAAELAEVIMTATKVFVLPNCMGVLSLEEFERRLPLVVDTLIDGFSTTSDRAT